MENLKVQFVTPRISIEKREANLFYYELRDSEVDNGYTIERFVLVNNIGSLVCNKDLLGEKNFITDTELFAMNFNEVVDLYKVNEV